MNAEEFDTVLAFVGVFTNKMSQVKNTCNGRNKTYTVFYRIYVN